MNGRFTHCFHDEDAMKWAKAVARRCSRRTLEPAMLKAANLRLKLLKWSSAKLNKQVREKRQ